ncbi:MAG: DNA internalization-related competence protein ComEC/Rec2 [Usitatibacter sp.]
MRIFILAFTLGTVALQQQAELPLLRWALAGAALLLGVALVPGEKWIARVLLMLTAGALAGFGTAAWRAEVRMAEALPRALEGEDVVVTGIVSGLPQVTSNGVRFAFEVEEGTSVPRLISLAWYEPWGQSVAPQVPGIAAGQRWQLTVRLKRPRGLFNPHAFDFEAWALERGIRATGYVRTKPGYQLLTVRVDGWPYTLHRWRGEIRNAMTARLGDARLKGVLVALAVGDQDAIAADDWEVFWRTGVGHLMSISGLHITMLAGLAFAFASFLWVRIPFLTLRLPARKAGIVAGVAAALAYSLLTGYAVPAQRTFCMLAVIALCVLCDRHGSPSRVLALAVLAVLLLDPWAVLAAGFWLSFGAVAAIFYVMGLRAGRQGRLAGAVREQLAVTVAMAPMLVALFQELSLVSPLANAFAIPIVSFVVVPLILLGAFLPLPALLDVAHELMLLTMRALEALAELPDAMLENHAPGAWTVAAALLGCAWLLAPRGVPLRSCGALWVAPMFLVVPPRPPAGEAWVDVLDVGNGLAVVVRTAGHALAYDTGPGWSGDADSGSRIVVPFLRGEGVRRLDGLVVSHADDDHAGGAMSVAASREPGWLLSPLHASDPLHGLVGQSLRCEAGRRWRWDGVEFAVLHPGREIYEESRRPGEESLRSREDSLRPREESRRPGEESLRPREEGRRPRVGGGPSRRKENDRSCVLRVATAAGCVLLTGDIEARAEAETIARDREALRCAVMLLPHHGSRTSSTPAFLDAVGARIGIVSVGHRNRFRHPNELVVRRYAERGVWLRRTDEEGALHVVLPSDSGRPIAVVGQAGRVRYWSEHRRTP